MKGALLEFIVGRLIDRTTVYLKVDLCYLCRAIIYYCSTTSFLLNGHLKANPYYTRMAIGVRFRLDTLTEGQPPVYFIKDHYMYIEPNNLQPMDGGFPICKYELKYVHQLQNLYFALTGLELTIDLNT
ncbi:hypothetical protein GCM10023149_21480 [Mucilaginibacter gynuensis]|uniref:Uncharacterized protein n=1 Tax=Mucilaginibacter gynuensis TaxID=1302236 RepID=A0ABP8GC71_9SPHI